MKHVGTQNAKRGRSMRPSSFQKQDNYFLSDFFSGSNEIEVEFTQ